MKRIIALSLCAAIAGCAHDQAPQPPMKLASAPAQKDRCGNWRFGSDDYMFCRKLGESMDNFNAARAKEAADEEAARDRAAKYLAMQDMEQMEPVDLPEPKPYVIPEYVPPPAPTLPAPPTRTRCAQFGNIVNCNSY